MTTYTSRSITVAVGVAGVYAVWRWLSPSDLPLPLEVGITLFVMAAIYMASQASLILHFLVRCKLKRASERRHLRKLKDDDLRLHKQWEQARADKNKRDFEESMQHKTMRAKGFPYYCRNCERYFQSVDIIEGERYSYDLGDYVPDRILRCRACGHEKITLTS